MALQPFVGPWPLLQFRILFNTDGRTPWTGDKPVASPLPNNTNTSMSRVCFVPMIPSLERANTVHVLDRAPTVIGTVKCITLKFSVALGLKNLRP
jgi:hypothetical protein